ncbi:hypothetical protein DPX16_0543 [Anabarilius grahami]|uniref:Ig-like domain-containing protein n=1 Tax=Anabarilius grahami TaxID=495550 RepID=A0A3N0XJE3_ANAGA|nr:hypothetical protein DPX16_0543 [Anabarilius grahami]
MTFSTILIWTLAVLCRESVGQMTVTQTPSELLSQTGQEVTVTCKTSRDPTLLEQWILQRFHSDHQWSPD